MRIGLVVNPIAGMGGPVGLKGTDGAGTLARAVELGATPRASERATAALVRAKPALRGVELLTGAGAMGADAATAAGVPSTIVTETPDRTSADDTRRLAAALLAHGVDTILVAGGDGTVRDVSEIVGQGARLLGIPTGVKMHSAVFATSPAAAGQLLALIAAGDPRVSEREAEVMDIDEAGLREGRVSARLFGTARMPFERTLVQNRKAGPVVSDDAALDALARRFAREMEEGRVYVLGCGTTMRRFKRALGFEGTLLGVDVVIDRRLRAADVTEAQLLRIVTGAKVTIVTGVTGGQGYVFGRGNQQIGPEVLSAVGAANVVVVTGRAKLLALDPPCLHVDTGSAAVDGLFTGYLPVRTAPDETMIMKVVA
jgi:predicted polyphosphate/ATP-dependent NAD kinase